VYRKNGAAIAAVLLFLIAASSVQGEEPATKADEAKARTDRSSVRGDEPTPKSDGSTSRTDVSSVREGESAPVKAEGEFGKGSWTLQFSGMYAHELYPNDHVHPVVGTVSVGYFFNDQLSMNLELPYYYVFQKGDDANAVGLNLLLREHFWKHDRWTLYAELEGGLFEADRRVPPAGTDFNFTGEFGLGATYHLCTNLHLMGGVRFFHLSNARLEGLHRNPDINSLAGYVGLMFVY
jgi:hypothetical protein